MNRKGKAGVCDARRFRNAGGFSLLEVIFAIFILGVSLVGLTEGISTALSSSKDSELQSTAALIAAGRIETLRAQGYLENGEQTGECEGLPLYRWKQSITSASIDGLHEVAVVVENSKSAQTVYELRTLLFEPPSYSTLDTLTERKNGAASKKPNKERKRR